MDNRCLLYTSDAADERSSVDLGGRRIIKKKKTEDIEVNDGLERKYRSEVKAGNKEARTRRKKG